MVVQTLAPQPSIASAVPFLAGNGLALRPLRREDINDTYLGWLNDPEVTRFMEAGTFPCTREELESFYQALSGSRDRVMLAIVEAHSGAHIGNIKLDPIRWIHRRATLGLLIGDKRFWGSGLGTEATRVMVEYAFQTLNLQRIDLGVYADHAAAIRAYEKVGFRIEGRFRRGLYREGRYWDSLWMGLLRDEFLPRLPVSGD